MTDTSENGHPEKLSPVEIVKAASNYLRGTIAEELRRRQRVRQQGQHPAAQAPRHLSAGRPRAACRSPRRRAAAKAKFYSFMVRTAIPGGRLTSDQLLAELDLCDEVGNTTLRITTRQGLQLHGVLKNESQAARSTASTKCSSPRWPPAAT